MPKIVFWLKGINYEDGYALSSSTSVMLYSDEIEIRLIELFFSIVEFKHILNSEKKKYFNLYKKPKLENPRINYNIILVWDKSRGTILKWMSPVIEGRFQEPLPYPDL